MILAHAGHWIIGLLQFAPVLAFIAWLVFSHLRDRRRRAGEPTAD